MKIAHMQKADFYVGVPATFFLSLCGSLKNLVMPPSKPAHVRTILFIELSEMGSMVLLSPLIDKVKKTHPDAALYFITFHHIAPALRLLQMIDEDKILTLRISRFSYFLIDLLHVVLKLRAIPFDLTFDLELFSRISAILSMCSGAPIKTGFDNYLAEGLYRGQFLTHPVTYNPHLHITKNFLSMFYALGEKQGDIPHSKCFIPDEEMALPPIGFLPEKITAFRERLYDAHPQLQDAQSLIILNPNSSQIMPLRRWPLTSYLALAQRLSKTPGMAIVITGIADEKPDADYICRNVNSPHVISLSGFTSTEDLIALYHLSDVMISNDSGPAHFSALAQMKTIILFGPETPSLYGSLNPNAHYFYKHLQCSPCSTAYNQRRSPCANNQCMQLITVDEVYEKTLQLLQAPATA